MDAVIGGWQISGIVTAQAGTPFNLTYTPNANQQVSPQISATYRGANEYRPNQVPGQAISQGKSNRSANTGYVNYINLAAFVIPPVPGRLSANYFSPFGTRRAIPAATPSSTRRTSTLNKRFNTPIESLKLEFRAEAYNILNHTNLYLPGNISGSQGTISGVTLATGSTPVSSQITGGVPTGGGQITSTFEPRILQFALKAHLLTRIQANAPAAEKWPAHLVSF